MEDNATFKQRLHNAVEENDEMSSAMQDPRHYHSTRFMPLQAYFFISSLSSHPDFEDDADVISPARTTADEPSPLRRISGRRYRTSRDLDALEVNLGGGVGEWR